MAQGFDMYIFFQTLISAMIGIGLLGVSFSGYLLKSVPIYQRWYLGMNLENTQRMQYVEERITFLEEMVVR